MRSSQLSKQALMSPTKSDAGAPPRICILKVADVTYISRVHRCALALAQRLYDVVVLSVEPRKRTRLPELSYQSVRVSIRSRIVLSRFLLPLRVAEGFLRLLYQF